MLIAMDSGRRPEWLSEYARGLSQSSEWDLTPAELDEVLHVSAADFADINLVPSSACPPTDLERYLSEVQRRFAVRRVERIEVLPTGQQSTQQPVPAPDVDKSST
jgi:hypothetical protein